MSAAGVTEPINVLEYGDLSSPAGLPQIAALCQIEKSIRGLSPPERLNLRQEHSKPIIDAFETWLAINRTRVSAKAPLGQALKYIAKYWDGLNLFLTDGRIEMDSNAPLGHASMPCRQWLSAPSAQLL